MEYLIWLFVLATLKWRQCYCRENLSPNFFSSIDSIDKNLQISLLYPKILWILNILCSRFSIHYVKITYFVAVFTGETNAKFVSTSSHRSIRSEMFIKIGVSNFTGKHVCWSLFLIMLQAFRPAILFKRDSNTVAFL